MGGGASAKATITAMNSYLRGHDPSQLEAMRLKICNPTASLYNNRTQIHAAIEFACLDLIGKHLNIPVCNFLGGSLNFHVEFASYLFFRDNDRKPGAAKFARRSSW